jgi:hypothetical protein
MLWIIGGGVALMIAGAAFGARRGDTDGRTKEERERGTALR